VIFVLQHILFSLIFSRTKISLRRTTLRPINMHISRRTDNDANYTEATLSTV